MEPRTMKMFVPGKYVVRRSLTEPGGSPGSELVSVRSHQGRIQCTTSTVASTSICTPGTCPACSNSSTPKKPFVPPKMVVIALPRPAPASGSVPKANSARFAAPSLSGLFVGPLWVGTVFRFVAAQSLKNCAPYDDVSGSASEHNAKAIGLVGKCTALHHYRR